jgi:DNA-binding transcriptional ArsR family regulator
LGDATRVRILQMLTEHGELPVSDLVARLGQAQPKVSNHVPCLRWCGFVATRRDHPSVYYRRRVGGGRPYARIPAADVDARALTQRLGRAGVDSCGYERGS